MAGYLSTPAVPNAGELSVLLGAMVGSVLGFLWFNCYPAQVFMGDTGVASIGRAVGARCAGDTSGTVARRDWRRLRRRDA